MMAPENLLARYSVLHELGRGATGAVYAARYRTTGAVVALKRLDPALLDKPDASLAGRFLEQARSARRLRHRNIVRIHDAGEAGGTVYVAMEMLEGESLRKILDDGPLRIARAIRIAHDVACGLAHAHLEGVVHGGIKPSNIIVLRSGVVKITDFGIGQAALLSGARDGSSYLSPEQARGEPIDHRSDLFSLGAVLYEMLTHRPPFGGGSPQEIVENIVHARPRPPSELNQQVPRALDEIVLSMLAGQPAVRMPGAPILLRHLQRLEEGLGLASDASAGADEPAASAPPAAPERGQRAPAPAEAAEPRDQAADREVLDTREAMAMMERESRQPRSSGSRRPAIFAALAVVLAVLGIAASDFTELAGFMDTPPTRSEPVIAARPVQETPATAPVASRLPAPLPVVEVTEPPVAAPAPEPLPPIPAAEVPEPPPAVTEQPPVVAEEPPAVTAQPPAVAEQPPAVTEQPPAVAEQPPAVAEQPPAGTAQLVLTVSPRGEIYIDGKHRGTTPPITTLDLEPGMHRIEVRSGSRKPFLTYVTVEAGDERRIRHDFNAKRIGPPT